MLEVGACLLCKTCCCEMPDCSDTRVTHENFVLLCVFDEILECVESRVVCLYRDSGACRVDEHDGLEHRVCQTCVVSHCLECDKLDCRHRDDRSVSLRVCTLKHSCCSACSRYVDDREILELARCCICKSSHDLVCSAACRIRDDALYVHVLEVYRAGCRFTRSVCEYAECHQRDNCDCQKFFHYSSNSGRSLIFPFYLCTLPDAFPAASAATSCTLTRLKSCSMLCFSADAATAKLIACWSS